MRSENGNKQENEMKSVVPESSCTIHGKMPSYDGFCSLCKFDPSSVKRYSQPSSYSPHVEMVPASDYDKLLREYLRLAIDVS